MNVLQEADNLINGDRLKAYGGATESFERIAGLWSAYSGVSFTALDVVNMMVLLKVSRTKGKFHRDSYVDMAGYAGLGEQLDSESKDYQNADSPGDVLAGIPPERRGMLQAAFDRAETMAREYRELRGD